MKPIFGIGPRLVRLFGALGLIGCTLHAQVADDAISVPVHFQAMYDATATGDPELPAHMNVYATGVSGPAQAAYGNSTDGGTDILTPQSGFARLRPGKTYLFGIDTFSSTRVRVKITPPSGHRVFINGVEHEMFDWVMGDGGLLSPQGSFSVRLDDGSGGAAGETGALRPGRVLWSVALGNLRNGKPAGSIRLSEDGITANTFKPAALYFDRDSKNQNGSYASDDGEVLVVKVNNILRQVYASTVLADIVEQSDHAFFIRLYARTDVPASADGQGVYNMAGKTPLHEFLIENPVHPALTALRVSKTTNQNGTLTMWTEMAKTTPTAGTTVWMVHDWVEKTAGATVVSSPVRHRWTYTDSDRNELMEVLEAAGTVVHSVFKRYDDVNFGVETSRELTSETVGYGGAAPVTTSYVYHTGFSDANAGNWHKIAGVSSTDGSWTTFYYCNEFRNRGQIFQVRKPHKDLYAADPGAGISGPGLEITTFAYDFIDYWGTQRLPTQIETNTDGIVTARSQFSYTHETITDASIGYESSANAEMTLLVATRKDYFNSTQYLTTVTRVYREDSDPQYKFFPGLAHSVERPDKTMTAMVYYRAAFSLNGPFTGNSSGTACVHVALQGTSDATMPGTTAMTSYEFPAQALPAGFRLAAGKSTEARTLLDSDGLPRVSDQRAFVGAAWVLTNQEWPSYTESIWPSITTRRTEASAPLWNLVANTWTAGRLTATVDETGIRQSFGYDSVGRVQTITKDGATAAGATIAAQTVTQTFDAAGRVTSRTTSGGGESLVATSNYDTAGRIVSQTAPGQGTTSYVYTVASRLTTVTLPTTFTQIEARLRDGRPLSRTGTAVVAEYYDYGVEPDGRRRTTVSARSPNDVRKQTAWTDWLGRATKRERPGFNGTTTYAETLDYHAATGQLTVQNRTGYAPTRYEYNGMGEAVRSGLDLNSNDALDLASTDRIGDSDTSIESYDGAYWVTAKSWVFHKNGDANKILTGTSRRRLTGLSPTLRGETRSWDSEGNESRQTVSVDVATKVVTASTTRPGLANAATQVSVNGFAVSSTGHDGLTARQTYDALGRVQSVIEPRTGTANTVSGSNFSITYVINTALPFERRDASNRLISSTAYDSAGRPIFTQNADSRTRRVSYTARGQVEYQWGSAGYPVSYVYDDYGQRTHLRTYRDPANSVPNYWEAATWPGGAVAAQDTEWQFDDYTGLLKRKYDHSRQFTEYTYNSRGQTEQRFWARTVPNVPALPTSGQRITTTYAYLAGTGEPQSITYNDGVTPGVSFLPSGGGQAYTRLGQPVAITDATGERSFGYEESLPWRLTRETLDASFYGGRKMDSLYEEVTNANTGDSSYSGHVIATVKGRNRGYRLGASPAATNYDLEHTYTGSAAGRLAGLVTKRESGVAVRQFIYGYESDSALVKSLAIGGNAFQVTRSFEAKRDLLTQIDSKWGPGALRTSYAYTYNDLRQRATAVQGGGANEAFAELGATHQRFTYNSRGELTAGTGYHGSDPASTEKPLDARLHAYDYDAIGNRQWSNSSGNAVVRDDYSANDLNQYTQRENNTLAVSGTANAAAKVAVSGPMPTPDGGQVLAGRPAGGAYWGSNLVVNNTSGPFVGDVKAYAALAGAGPGGKDLFRVETKAAWLPPVVQVFAYDLDGNLTSDGLWDYTWDAENRLIRMQTTTVAALAGRPNQALEFTYDYRHRRVKKKVVNLTAGTVTSERKFIYDGWNVIAETDTGGTIKRSFTWGLDISGSAQGAGGVGGLLQIHDVDQTKTLFPCYDGNGNIGALVNADTGTIEASYEYSPFGELQRCAGAYAAANPFRFSTKWQDDETGLVYYGVRYYAPREGRFLGRDPIAEEGGLNLYGFCGNDGINHWDYLGNWSLKKFLQKTLKIISPIISVVTTMMGMPMVGVLINTALSAAAGASFKDLAVGFAVGAAAGYIGGPISSSISRGIGLAARDLGTSLIRGALTGGLAGAGTAAIYHQNILKGFATGAAVGMAMAGAIHEYRAYKTEQFIKSNLDLQMKSAPDDQRVLDAIRDYGQSPDGAGRLSNFVKAGEKLFIRDISENPYGETASGVVDWGPNTDIPTNRMFLNMDQKRLSFPALLAHEMGHTKTGGFVSTDEVRVVQQTQRAYEWWSDEKITQKYGPIQKMFYDASGAIERVEMNYYEKVPQQPLWQRILTPALGFP